MKKISLFILILLAGTVLGQNLRKYSLSAGGGSGENANLYLAYALGEIGTKENSAGNLYLSEGFIGPDLYEIMGVEDYETLQGVSLLPNPFKDYLNISLAQAGNYEIRVYDLTGKEVFRTDVEQNDRVRLNLSHLNSGTYIIGIADRTNRKFAALKIVKR